MACAYILRDGHVDGDPDASRGALHTRSGTMRRLRHEAATRRRPKGRKSSSHEFMPLLSRNLAYMHTHTNLANATCLASALRHTEGFANPLRGIVAAQPRALHVAVVAPVPGES